MRISGPCSWIGRAGAVRLEVGLLYLVCGAPIAFARKPPSKPSNEDCLVCHGDSTMTTDVNGKQISLFVNPDALKNSIHGSMFNCVDCHSDVKTSPHEVRPSRITCAQCHADQQAAYERSYHAKAIRTGDGQAATCVNCHGSPHYLLPGSDPKSRVSHANIPATCGGCHGQKFVMAASGHSASRFSRIRRACTGARLPRDPTRLRFAVIAMDPMRS